MATESLSSILANRVTVNFSHYTLATVILLFESQEEKYKLCCQIIEMKIEPHIILFYSATIYIAHKTKRV